MASQPQGIADDCDVNQILHLSARYRVCNSFPLPAHAVLSPAIRLARSLLVRVPVLNTSSSFSAWCAYDMALGTVEMFGDLLAPATSLLVQPDVVSHGSGFFALNQMLEMQKVWWVTQHTLGWLLIAGCKPCFYSARRKEEAEGYFFSAGLDCCVDPWFLVPLSSWKAFGVQIHKVHVVSF